MLWQRSQLIGLAVVFSIVVLGAGNSGCSDDAPPAIVNKWEDKKDFHGWKDNFEIEEDLEGEGKFWTSYSEELNTVYYSEYDLEAEKDGDEWVIDAESNDGANFDFEMECQIDDDELECECSDGYCGDYEWTFEED